GKAGDLRLEHLIGGRYAHFVLPFHESKACGKRATRRVLESFSWREDGLLSDDAGPAHVLYSPVAIGDLPMTVDELDHVLAAVFNRDRVEEEPQGPIWIRMLLGKPSLHVDPDATARRLRTG